MYGLQGQKVGYVGSRTTERIVMCELIFFLESGGGNAQLLFLSRIPPIDHSDPLAGKRAKPAFEGT